MLVVVALLGGCQAGYYTQAARGQMKLLAAREPIEPLVSDPATPEPLRSTLRQVLEVRTFASRELGLPDNDSYRSYVEIDGPYIVWNVVAAEEFSVNPRTWCFPFVGCVSYKGYFSEDSAHELAHKLAGRGYDTYVGGVAAYSTLGKFDDPVLSTMLRWDDARMAGLIFHELAHQQLYIKDDTSYNEAFATVVEEEGLRRWLVARGQEQELEAWRSHQSRRQAFANLVSSTRGRLNELYAQALPVEEMRERKAAEIEQMRNRYAALKASWGGYAGYDAWFAGDLNNARLSSVSTYRRLVPAFRALLQEAGGDFTAFYASAAALAELPEDARAEQLRVLMAVSGPSSATD